MSFRINEIDFDESTNCRVDGLPAVIIGATNTNNELMFIVRTKLGEVKPVSPANIHLEVNPDEWEWADPVEEDEDDEDEVVVTRRARRNSLNRF